MRSYMFKIKKITSMDTDIVNKLYRLRKKLQSHNSHIAEPR